MDMFFGDKLSEVDVSERSDEDILSMSVNNPALFDVLLNRYQQAFFRKVLRVVGTKEDAEDVVQDTFVKIYRYADRFKPQEGASFKSWGYRILLNTSFTHYQKMKKKGSEFVDIPSEFYDVLPDLKAEDFEIKEVKDDIASVFSKMPKHLVKVLRLHFVEGRPHKEIAEREGLSVSAVKTRVHRAKKEFRKHSKEVNL